MKRQVLEPFELHDLQGQGPLASLPRRHLPDFSNLL